MKRDKIKNIARNILGIPSNSGVRPRDIIAYYKYKYGKYFYKKKFSASELIEEMKSLGMQKGANIFIHSSWNEFYNYTGTEEELIKGILDVIGEEGTLAMPAYPLMRKGKIFILNKTATRASLFAESFRRYPGVKRSINIQHSVCAIGKYADFLLSEHHLGSTCWDEKSPYYRLGQINALVFSLGLRKYFIGTILHCVESMLMNELPYYRYFFKDQPTVFDYKIDNSSPVLQYSNYEVNPACGRRSKEYGTKIIAKKYLPKESYGFAKISNLQISVFKAAIVIPKVISLGRKGIDIFKYPSKRGYEFL